MGIVSQRRRRERARRLRMRLMIAAGIAQLSSLAMAQPLREKLAGLSEFSLPVFETGTQAELTLPKREMYALQLGVFDSGERAASEAQRLQNMGVQCIVWQREKMRIVSSVALSREGLNHASAGGNEAYVIKDVLPKVSLRIQAGVGQIASVQRLLELPDEILMHLLTGEQPLDVLVSQAKEIAQAELGAHPEHALYTQLAQSLVNWCALMETTMQENSETQARNYAAVTVCTLCRELRLALQSQASQAIEASTASAQRTPSTAADVMPPA